MASGRKVDFDRGAKLRSRFHVFTPWVPWDDRASLRDAVWNNRVDALGGVYLLAHFSRKPKGPADWLDAAILHVGEAPWLRRHWYLFQGAARDGQGGEERGEAYYRRYTRKDWAKLHVAALPVFFGEGDTTKEEWSSAYRRYVQARITWELTARRKGNLL